MLYDLKISRGNVFGPSSECYPDAHKTVLAAQFLIDTNVDDEQSFTMLFG